MKKIFLLITVLMLVGCSKKGWKADIVCTEKNDLYTTNVELYFKNGELTDAISISEYKDEDLANQICATLGEKVKCYKNKVEIVDYMKDYMGKSKYDVLERLEGQGLTCK